MTELKSTVGISKCRICGMPVDNGQMTEHILNHYADANVPIISENGMPHVHPNYLKWPKRGQCLMLYRYLQVKINTFNATLRERYKEALNDYLFVCKSFDDEGEMTTERMRVLITQLDSALSPEIRFDGWVSIGIEYNALTASILKPEK